MSGARRSLLVAILAACSGNSDTKPVPPPAPQLADAGVDGIGTIGVYDPSSGAHLDDYVPADGERPRAKRVGRPIEILLRSTPPGARVHADGQLVGLTPTYWQGETGEHEFTFVLERHALARYRFHAITTGVVHAQLEPVVVSTDAGVPPPGMVRQIPAPQTMVTPDAAAPLAIDAGAPPIVIDAPAPVPVTVDAAVDAASVPVGPQP